MDDPAFIQAPHCQSSTNSAQFLLMRGEAKIEGDNSMILLKRVTAGVALRKKTNDTKKVLR